MITGLSQIYIENRGQIDYLLRGRSEMFRMGFRNGVISKIPECTITSIMSDYGAGYMEGWSYARYKLTLKKRELEIILPDYLKNDEPKKDNITVGFVVQNYDFSFQGLESTALAKRQSAIIEHIYNNDGSVKNKTISQKYMAFEETKLGRMYYYLRRLDDD